MSQLQQLSGSVVIGPIGPVGPMGPMGPSHITMGSPFKSVQILDQITGEVYELVIRDGKMEILATSQQGIRQQKIESVIKEDE
jgi:hypothetical protein